MKNSEKDRNYISIYLNQEEVELFEKLMRKLHLGNTLDGGNKSKAVKMSIKLALAKLNDIDKFLKTLDEETKEIYLKTFKPIKTKSNTYPKF